MKKITGIFAMMMLLFTAVAVAQPGGGRGQGGERMTPEERAEKQTSKMVGELELNEEQAAQVEELNLTSAAKISELREANRGNREAMMEGMKGIQDERETALKDILSEDQYAKHLEMVAKEEERRGNRGEGRRGPRPEEGE